MKVLFLYPNSYGLNMLPPAIGLFTSLLKKQGHKVDLFDSTNWVEKRGFNSDKAKEKNLNSKPFDDFKLSKDIHYDNVFVDFRNKVKNFSPDLIAISATESIFSKGIRLLNSVKDLKIPVIIGGVFATFAPDICLSYKEIDMVCIGEGEEAIIELCNRMEKNLDYKNIKNIWIKNDNNIIKNPLRSLCDINKNPVPDFSLFEESRFYRPMQGKVRKMLPVETHRGCPNQCAYCNSPTQKILYRQNTGEKYFRKKSFDAIKKELLYYKENYKAESFYFWADSFMTYTDREFEEFLEMYSDINIPFWCQIFPREINEQRIKKAMNAGLFRIGSGIEHGNENFRKKILNRKIKNSKMIENFKILKKCDLPFSVNNIIGFPTETKGLAMETIELNKIIDADDINAYFFIPFHGTPLRKMCESLKYCKSNLITDIITKESPLNMPQFTPEEIKGLQRCFVMYVRMPKNRWKDIQKAESFTTKGNKVWEELRGEYLQTYV